MNPWLVALLVLLGAIALVALHDVIQRKRAILRNFPVLGHMRHILEALGPKLRQYIVTDNDEERPFSRDQRRWVYASATKDPNEYFGFGTDNEVERTPGYLIVRHAAMPLPEPHAGDPSYDPMHRLPCAKVIGAARERRYAFRPASVVNVSAMSFGSLGARAVQAINEGCAIAGCLQNTGEGGISPYHRRGGDLIYQIGTGYFGCRDATGALCLDRLVETAGSAQVRAIEFKLSQGAKPGLGGLLPGAKVTPEIAKIRGIPVGKDCFSPSGHTAFRSVDELLDVVEQVAERTGLPVGVKSAIGELDFWTELAERMAKEPGRGLDYIQVDGGEGGTGAAPLAFSDHVALPFKLAFTRVYRLFAERGITDRLVFAGSGKLGFPENALLAFALGCDLIMVAREPMLAIGCIQAQECHTGHCPTGVATHNRWLMRGLDPTLKAARLANYMVTLRKELARLSRACGMPHPAFLPAERIELLDGRLGSSTAAEHFGYSDGWGRPSQAQLEELHKALAELPLAAA